MSIKPERKWLVVTMVKLSSYKSITEQANCEVRIRNSQFIGTIAPVLTEEDASRFLGQMRHTYRDASHNVFAFRILRDNGLLERQSDDGEPSGTAGKPTLDVLAGAGLINVCVNVTRYFGGTLLGTGGLVRAYQAAAREAIAHATISEFKRLVQARIILPYPAYDKFLYTANNSGFIIADSEFSEHITLTVICLEEDAGNLQQTIIGLAHTAQISFGEPYYGTLL